MRFHYLAKKGPKDIVEGTLTAGSFDQAVGCVSAMGLIPLDIREAPASVSVAKKARIVRAPVKAADLSAFTRQMSDLAEASVPLLRALEIILNQTQRPGPREIVQNLYDAVRDGASLSQALAGHPNIFSRSYVHMVQAGELSGHPEVIFKRLAETLDKQDDMRRKMISNLAYPFLILAVGVLVIFVFMIFIVPKIAVMFDDIGQSLPWPTLVLLSVSRWFSSFWWLIAGALIAVVWFAVQRFKTSEGRRRLEEMLFGLPWIGASLKTAVSAQFCRTLAVLLESGVTLHEALDGAVETVESNVFRARACELTDRIAKGERLSSALKPVGFFSDMLIGMIAVGEETGRPEAALSKAAEAYERRTDENLRTAMSLLGPMVLIVVISIVGGVVLALLLPILQMSVLVG